MTDRDFKQCITFLVAAITLAFGVNYTTRYCAQRFWRPAPEPFVITGHQLLGTFQPDEWGSFGFLIKKEEVL
jgi:hypothetical protein